MSVSSSPSVSSTTSSSAVHAAGRRQRGDPHRRRSRTLAGAEQLLPGVETVELIVLDGRQRQQQQQQQRRPKMTSACSRRVNGDLLTMVGFQGARHVVSGRLPSGLVFDRIVGIRLPDLSDQTTECVRDLHSTLKRIELSGLCLTRFPDDLVGELYNLELLDVSDNELTELTLPVDGQPCLVGLVELIAYRNILQRAITADLALQLGPTLRRLNLASNRLTEWEAIGQLCNLQVLILDDNQLSVIDDDAFENLRRLEVFHCARNNISDIPSSVRQLKCLRDLDLSGNHVTSLPPELLQLPRLEVLNLSCNAIRCVPTVRLSSAASLATDVAIGNRRQGNGSSRLSTVDLSDNAIERFPQQLFSIVRRRLDLSRNRIHVIPLGLERTLWTPPSWNGCFRSPTVEASTRVVLNVDENPMECPPEDVCCCGTRAIANYLSEVKAQLPTYQGLKLLVIGSSGAGKTSWIQTLIDDEPRLTGNDRTTFIDTFDYVIDAPPDSIRASAGASSNPAAAADGDGDAGSISSSPASIDAAALAAFERQLTLSVWDFSGQERCSSALLRFVEHPSLVVLTFSLRGYDRRQFDARLGSWLDWVASRGRKVVCVVVATHADCVRPEKLDGILGGVSAQIARYLSERISFVDATIRSIESLPHIEQTQSEHLKRCRTLRSLDLQVHPEIVAVSSASKTGFRQLAAVIRRLGCDTDAFPMTLRRVPSLWNDVERFVEGCGAAMPVPILSWPAYEKLVVSKFGLKRAVTQITQYLHDTGKVWWCATDDTSPLSRHVVLRPHWLLDALRALFRHDLLPPDPVPPTATNPNDSSQAPTSSVLPLASSSQPPADPLRGDEQLISSCRQAGVPVLRFDRLRAELAKQGVADIDYVRVAWQPLGNVYSTQQQQQRLNQPLSDGAGGDADIIASLLRLGCSYRLDELIGLVCAGFQFGYRAPRSFARDGSNVKPHISRSAAAVAAVATTVAADPASSAATVNPGASSKSAHGAAPAAAAVKPSSKQTLALLADRTRFVVSSLRKVGRPRTFQDVYDPYSGLPCVAAVYQFPRYLPPGFYDRLTVRLGCAQSMPSTSGPATAAGKSRQHKASRTASAAVTSSEPRGDGSSKTPPYTLLAVYHWQFGFYAYDPHRPVRVYVQRGKQKEDGVSFVRIEVRLDDLKYTAIDNSNSGDLASAAAAAIPGGEEQRATVNDDLWAVMLPVLQEADRVLASFAGVYVERRMECPLCHSASFDGAWSTPKQLQNVNSATCRTCEQPVDTSFLVQPKEKRAVEQFIQMLEAQQLQQQQQQQQEPEIVSKAPDTSQPEEQQQEEISADLSTAGEANNEDGSSSTKVDVDAEITKEAATALNSESSSPAANDEKRATCET